jgi:ATP/maltotriose-dependent transcriptional regulator MalT
MLAELDLLEGSVETAEATILRSLEVYTEVESDRDRAECLVVLGCIAVARGSYEEAARLLGAAEALRGESPVNRFERPVLDRFEPELVAELGDETVAVLKSQGRRHGVTMSRRDVVMAGGEE